MIFLSLIVSIYSFAYIPSTQLILQRSGRPSQKSVITLTQEITLSSPSQVEPSVFREVVTFENEDNFRIEMHLPDDSSRLSDRSYKNGKSSAASEGSIQPETLFFFQKSVWLARTLKSLGILPESYQQKLGSDAQTKNISSIKHSPFKLSPYGGSVAFMIGSPSNFVAIEQDTFHVKALEVESKFIISAGRLNEFAGGLKYPEEYRISLPGEITGVVKTLSLQRGGQDRLSKADSKKSTLNQDTISDPRIAEFYRAFR